MKTTLDLLLEWFPANGGIRCDPPYEMEIGFEDRETFDVAKLAAFLDASKCEREVSQPTSTEEKSTDV